MHLEAVGPTNGPPKTAAGSGIATLAIATLAVIAANIPIARAAPTAEVAKRCLHYAYAVYPFKRPGSVPMSGDRQAYFNDCLAKNGDVPAPPANKASAASAKN